MNKYGQTDKSIDRLNEKLWKKRFSRLHSVEKSFKDLLKKAEAEGYAAGVAAALLNLSALYFFNSATASSVEYLNRALAWYNNNKSQSGYVRALLLQGNIAESYGDYGKALSCWLEALKLAGNISSEDSEAEACSQLGLVYYRLSDYTKALEYLSSGLKIREKLGDMNGVASSLNRIAMVHRATGKYEQALEHYRKSLDIRKKNRQSSAVPWTFLGMGNSYEDSGENNKALDLYRKGMVRSDDRCRLQCIMGTGRILSRLGKSIEAEKKLKEALSMAENIKSLYLVAEAYLSLSKHYEQTRDTLRALESYKLYQKTREELLGQESLSRLRNTEIAHAVEKSEQEKEIFRLKNVELKNAYDIIEEKNKDITSGISYAERIQKAMLPRVKEVRGLPGSIFILYKPKDILSGDFYWFARANKNIIIAAGDCTGHGVPGALMSMLGISFLEEIVNRLGITSPGKILDLLSAGIRKALRQKGDYEDTKDGMDISICLIDRKAGLVRFAGANNNLFVLSAGTLSEYKADRMPAGYSETPDKRFTETEISVSNGDILYMFSDGYADQFGGPDDKKYKSSRLKEHLLKIHKLPLKMQKTRLEQEFLRWKGDKTQVDDILITGFRI